MDEKGPEGVKPFVAEMGINYADDDGRLEGRREYGGIGFVFTTFVNGRIVVSPSIAEKHY